MKIFEKFKSELKNKNFSEADKYLATCHIISSTFKALSSWKAVKISREASITNKYSILKTTMLPKSFTSSVPSVTYEGDNSVLLQQTSKFLIMKPSSDEPQKPSLKFRDDDMEALNKILRYVSFKEIERVKKIF